jgi:hypothetical protein
LSRRSQVALVVLVVIVAMVLLFVLRYPGKARVTLHASECDSALWNHVYEKDRLQVLEPCTAVEGRVVSVQRSSDGDAHVSLAPDDPAVLNFFNVTHSHRLLAVEIICEHAPTRSAPVAACADFTSTVTVPLPGDRVRVTGTYVTDRDIGWREIHPVTRIEVLR